MHMSDSLVSPTVGVTMYGLSGLVASYSIYKLRQEKDLNKKIPTMGVMGAFVFATQMINFTIPGTGSSGHLCGGLLLSAIIGPYAGFLSMVGVLLIQALLFGDGGLLTLGSNIWNMAFYGCFIGTLIWKSIMNSGVSRKKIWIASILGSIISLQLGALSVTIETSLSNVTELPFTTFISLMLPIHLVIGLIEGLITGAILNFIYEARPELLNIKTNKEAKISYKKVLAILTCIVLVIGGGVSLLASSYPDGLEWSIARITGNTKIENTNEIYETTKDIQEKTTILPDYNLKDNNTKIGTSISGIIGSVITIVILIVVGFIINITRKKRNTINE